MGDVQFLGVETTLDVPPGRVLQRAIDAGLEQVIVIGIGADGPYHASSTADSAEIIFRMELFKRELLERAARRS